MALEKLEAPPDYSELSPKEKFGWASDKLGQVKARLEHFTEALGREDLDFISEAKKKEAKTTGEAAAIKQFPRLCERN